MYAVLGWVDGFGNDTDVIGIFKGKEEAEKFREKCNQRYNEEFKIQKFDFGEVYFNYYEGE